MAEPARKSTKEPKPTKTPKWVAMAVFTIAALAVAFFGGWAMGRSGASAARAEAVQARAELRQERTGASVLRARNYFYHAAVQLDRRNFGTANSDVQQAAHQLQAADFPKSDPRRDAVAPIAADAAKLNLGVAEDVAEQRAAVLDLAARLDSVAP